MRSTAGKLISYQLELEEKRAEHAGKVMWTKSQMRDRDCLVQKTQATDKQIDVLNRIGF